MKYILNLREFNLLNESSDKLMRIMNNHLKKGCIIASFQRSSDNTLTKKIERLELLKDFVFKNGYGYIVMDGRYVYQEDNDELNIKKGDISDEFSLLIPMKYTRKKSKEVGVSKPTQKEFDDFAQRLCDEGDQESVLICFDNMYWWEGSNGKVKAELSHPTIADAASVFYSRIRKGANRKEEHGNLKYGFSLEIDQVYNENAQLCSINILGNSNYAMVAECKKKGDIRTSHLLELNTLGSMMDYDILNGKFIQDSIIRKDVLHYL